MSSWHDENNLYQGWLVVKKKGSQGGLDNRSITDYETRLKANLHKLSEKLANKKYVPEPGKRINMTKSDGSKRPVSLVTVEDKIVQHAVKKEIEPLFETEFLDCSYAYRPGRGHRKAIHHLTHYLSQNLHWITTCDIDDFFDSIQHELLMEMLRKKIKETYILDLISMWIKIGAFAGDRYLENREGVPQGAVISPLLSNIYLHPFDVEMRRRKAHYVRYADDYVIAEKSRDKAQAHYQFAIHFLKTDLRLRINLRPSPVFHLDDGFTFLGIYFKGGLQTIDKKKFQKALDKVEKIFGKSLRKPFHQTIQELNEAVNAWLYYYGECENTAQFQTLQIKMFDKLAYLLYRLAEDGRMPQRSYLRNNLNRLKLLVELDPGRKKNLFKQILSARKRIDYQKVERIVSKDRDHKKVKTSTGKKAKGKPKGEAGIKRAIAAKKSKYIRKFASDFDLVLAGYGNFLGRHQKRLVVRRSNGQTREYAASKMKHIIVMNPSVSFSSAAVFLCAKNNIPIDFIDYTGKPFARLAAPEQPAWRYGMYQLNALHNGKGLVLAKAFVEGKIRNQRNLIKYYAKYRKEKDSHFSKLFETEDRNIKKYLHELENMDNHQKLDTVRGKLFGVEGRSAGSYWRTVRYLLKSRIVFEGRKRRGAKDLINSLLNYGYGILYSRVWGALMLAGLNVQISFLHRPQYEKPTLVYDVIEEFRTQVVDRVVISMLNRGEKFTLDKKGYLNRESKNKLIENIFERLNTPVKFRKRDRTLQEIIQYQARAIGKYLKDEKPSYQPFIAKW